MLTILVVDDEKLERKGIRFLLNRRSEEMEILEAANGKAACEILQHRTVDIMLTDIKMPFMDGIELVSVAHKLQPDLQMVIFSGYGEFAYAKKAMASGVSNYVLKPVDPAEFENTLNLPSGETKRSAVSGIRILWKIIFFSDTFVREMPIC